MHIELIDGTDIDNAVSVMFMDKSARIVYLEGYREIRDPELKIMVVLVKELKNISVL